MSDSIAVAVTGRVATITLNRPERLNAFDGPMMGRLRGKIEELAASEVRVIVLTGAGRAFCAGADVRELGRLQAERDTTAFRGLLKEGKKIFLAIRECRQPVIAAVNGVAAGGGCSLALAVDIRLAARTATFIQAFARIGLHPDFGAYWSLPELVGRERALRLMMTAETVDADRALAWGLVSEVTAEGDLAERTRWLAGQLAGAPRRVVAAVKQGLAPADRDACERLLDFEIERQVELFESQDAAEGIGAFLEKRAPSFE